MWCTWLSVDEFEAWHLEVKGMLGIPHPNRNVRTGVVDEGAAWTTEFVVPYWVAGLPVAWVPDDTPVVSVRLLPSPPPPVVEKEQTETE